MDIPAGVVFGVLAMLGWGVSDFFAARAVRKTGVLKTFFWSQAVSLVLVVPVLSAFFEFPLLSLTTAAIILAAGALDAIGFLALYKGMQVGKVSVVSPIAACWAAVTVILSLAFLGETLSYFQGVGVCLAIIGASLASFRLRDVVGLRVRNLAAGVKYAIIALFGWGVYFVLFDVLATELGWFLPVFLTKSTIIFLLLAHRGFSREDIPFPRNVTSLIILIAVADVVAFLSYGLGVSSDYTAIVAPVSAAFPMVTVILAKLFLKEKLETNQKFGIISVVASLVLLSM